MQIIHTLVALLLQLNLECRIYKVIALSETQVILNTCIEDEDVNEGTCAVLNLVTMTLEVVFQGHIGICGPITYVKKIKGER